MDNFSEISRCSSMDEVLINDAHDPNLSRLAKNMFQKTFDYLNFELSSNILDYELLDKMNQTASKSVETMKKTADEIVEVNDDLNQKFKDLTPLMKELEEIEITVNKLEAAAYRLDSYSKRLEEKINEHISQQQQKLKTST
ncbi:hypothetical protein PVAND_006010 [Polypedilum vanderplanki]|uniref:Biogenesis of lysosome-related organelles complex 1 subunit 2 n=1 Tax=Polypedilum vanderplanki TaxID=319348 RepID=A0A9J6C1T8_POLVA|nr:hypothetical protein PVAND_006010 [Polypedilum vanderplanki]